MQLSYEEETIMTTLRYIGTVAVSALLIAAGASAQDRDRDRDRDRARGGNYNREYDRYWGNQNNRYTQLLPGTVISVRATEEIDVVLYNYPECTGNVDIE